MIKTRLISDLMLLGNSFRFGYKPMRASYLNFAGGVFGWNNAFRSSGYSVRDMYIPQNLSLLHNQLSTKWSPSATLLGGFALPRVMQLMSLELHESHYPRLLKWPPFRRHSFHMISYTTCFGGCIVSRCPITPTQVLVQFVIIVSGCQLVQFV